MRNEHQNDEQIKVTEPGDDDRYRNAACLGCYWYFKINRIHGKCRAMPPATTHSLSALIARIDAGEEIDLRRHLIQPTVSPLNKCSFYLRRSTTN